MSDINEIIFLEWSENNNKISKDTIMNMYKTIKESAEIDYTYYKEKKKKWILLSNFFTALSLLGLSGGLIFPIIYSDNLKIGYVFLIIGSICLTLEKYTASTSNWTRFTQTQLRLLTEINLFEISWVSEINQIENGIIDGDKIPILFGKLFEYYSKISQITMEETKQWSDQKNNLLNDLRKLIDEEKLKK